MAYTLMVNTWQLALIETALANLPADKVPTIPDDIEQCGISGFPCSSENDKAHIEEHAALLELIREIPENEKKDPGIIHGCCL